MSFGGADIYQSPYDPSIDALIQNIVMGGVSGQSISPSPAVIGPTIAQSIGGTYDAKSGQIKAPDGSTYKYNAATNQVEPTSGGGIGNWQSFNKPIKEGMPTTPGMPVQKFGSEKEFKDYIASGKQVLDAKGNVVSPYATGGSEYADKIQQVASGLQTNVFQNPSSAWNTLGQAFTQKYYDPKTGLYSSTTPAPQQPTSDYYLKSKAEGGTGLGDFLNTKYVSQPEYQQSAAYNPFVYKDYNYQAPTVKSVDPVIDQAWEDMYGLRAKDTEARARENKASAEDWSARQGGSLGSGRLAGLNQDINRTTQTDLDTIRKDVSSQQALQKYQEAKDVRDQQLGLDWEAQKLRGGEARYGQDVGLGEQHYGTEQGIAEKKYGYETKGAEDKYAFEQGQKQGAQKLQSAEALDAAARDRAWAESQAGKQDTMNMLTYLDDLMRVYAGQDSTAAQMKASENAAIGSALGSLFGAAGSVGSAFG